MSNRQLIRLYQIDVLNRVTLCARVILILMLAVLLVLTGAACAETRSTEKCPGASGEAVQVRSVNHQLEMILTDGRIVRLRGLRAPRGTEQWPGLAEMARFALARWIEGRSLRAEIEAGEPDRWGRNLARLWIRPQEANGPAIAAAPGLIEAGWAFVDPDTISKSCRSDYFKRENMARSLRLGLWASPYYQPQDALGIEALMQRAGEIVLVEGQVADVRTWKSLVFVNFSKKRGEGLGLMLTRRAQRAFTAADIKPASLKGRKIRVRGLLELRTGRYPAPRITLSGPASVEFLE